MDHTMRVCVLERAEDRDDQLERSGFGQRRMGLELLYEFVTFEQGHDHVLHAVFGRPELRHAVDVGMVQPRRALSFAVESASDPAKGDGARKGPPPLPRKTNRADSAGVPDAVRSDDTTLEIQRRIGTTIGGKYRLDHLLGLGGMGAVYRAHHLLLKRDVAIKILHRDRKSTRLNSSH